MGLYTKQGDLGKTRLYCNLPIDKYSPRIECFGTIDELNAAIGHAASFTNDKEILTTIKTIQNELFNIGSELANPDGNVTEKNTKFLEAKIDDYNSRLPELKNFILPSGSQSATAFQLARTICRRAERRVCLLNKFKSLDKGLLAYVNRLSDLLFVLARLANQKDGLKEDIWRKEND